jgi:hypothetical protein
MLTSEAQPSSVIGRFVARGLDDELTGTAFAVVDGTDGRAHHIRLPDLDAAGDFGPGAIVELRRYEDSKGRQRLALAIRSDFAIEAQRNANGATWLDRQLLARETTSLSDGGFGREVREAMDARVEFLVSEGLARRQGQQRVIFIRDLLETLRLSSAPPAQRSRRRPVCPLIRSQRARASRVSTVSASAWHQAALP